MEVRAYILIMMITIPLMVEFCILIMRLKKERYDPLKVDIEVIK